MKIYRNRFGRRRKLSEVEGTSYDNKCAHCTCTKASCVNCASCKTLPSCLFSKSEVYGIHDHAVWENGGFKLVKQLSPVVNRPKNAICLKCLHYRDELCHALTEPPFTGYQPFKPLGPPDELDVCDFYKEMKKIE